MIGQYQYPSVFISDKTRKDITQDTRDKYRAAANVLLYQLSNLVELGNIDFFTMTRIFTDGTVIVATFNFGKYSIDIRPVMGRKEDEWSPDQCNITLFNVPEVVQPMHWYKEGILDSEVEGVDFLRTYYTVDKCNKCELDFTVCKTNILQSEYGYVTIKKCLPFFFVNKKVQGRDDNPDNHCIHTMSGCQAEIIEFNEDDNGNYFLWKIYTEWSNLGPAYVDFSQNGFGYLSLIGTVSFNGTPICSGPESIVAVDCCQKELNKRPIVIQWEDPTFGWEPVDQTLAYNDLLVETYFWVNPLSGVCIPIQWELTGTGTLTPTGTWGQLATYTPPVAGNCNDTIVIQATDRCGNSYTITRVSCCASAPALSIGYTTLAMSCSGSQTLTAGGGCGPYTFTLTAGGGTLVDNGDGTALYTAPAANAECASNPTISVSDCCGGSDSIQIAVNCYVPATEALRVCDFLTCVHACQLVGTWCHYHKVDGRWSYNCDGTILSTYFEIYINRPVATFDCDAVDAYGGTAADYTWGCSNLDPSHPCTNSGTTCNSGCACTEHSIGSGCNGKTCGIAYDYRTAGMKTAGCCPLNPITGLPY